MIRAIIIDDEADGRQALKLVLEKYCPEVQVLASCVSAKEGLEHIEKFRPDLVFLDVQMPELSGFDLLERVPKIDFAVIFVTAFDRYAIKAIRFSALDYLLKPIDVDELLQALRRYKQHKQYEFQFQSVIRNIKNPTGKMEKLAIPSLEEIIFLETSDIIYCQADGNYTSIHLISKRKIFVSKKLKDFEQILTDSGFCRVHHSSLINMQHIQKYVKGDGGYVLLSEGHQVTISRRKKEEFLSLFAQL